MKILIVDDHEDNLYLLEALLKGNGHEIRQASNGAEALEILQAGGIDLIISDILMPVMDGFQLCRKVRADPRLHHIPLIIYTATYTGPKDEEFALKIGADRFILKPCEPEVFRDAVADVMAAAARRDGTAAPEEAPEQEVLKLYSERLVRKLEQKMAEAEREMTARREAEKALRASEEKYRSILDNISAGYYEVDLAGNFTFFNDAMCKILGYSCSELMCKNNREYMDSENAKKVFETFNRVFTNGTPAKGFNWQLIKKDGGKCCLDTSVFLVQDDRGNAIGFRGIAQDITARKQAEDALRESEAKYRRLAENISDVIWTMDLNLKTTYVSPSVERLLGEPVAVHLTKTIADRLTPASLEKVSRIFLDELENEKNPQCDKNRTRIVEVEHYRADRSTIWVSINLAFLRDEHGTPVGILGITRDITEHKRAEEAQQQLQARLMQAVEIAHLGYWEYDVAKDLFIFDDAFYKIFRITADQVGGCTMSPKDYADRFIHPDDRSVVADENRKAIETIDPFYSRHLEHRILYADGTIGHMAVRFFVIKDDQGKTVKTYGVNQDITERKQAEAEREKLQAQLLQAQKMESVGRLAGGVAHDFNNMLGVILGYGELALGRVAPDDALHADLTEIMTAARRSADMTRQLLAFARKQTVAPKVLDLNETVEGMLRMLRRLIGEDIDLCWLPTGKLWLVKIDPAQIDQILANLCVNARDAIAGVGKITIETDNARLDREYCAEHPGFIPGQYVLLAVSDNGCGMDKATLNKLFEPFFTTKEVGKGTGLGLATVYGIVKQNNGFVNVNSESGRGTTFRIYLPRHSGQPEPIPVSDGNDIPRGRGETVLMVEDEAAVLKLGRKLLEGLGYSVLSAANPGEAMALAEERAGAIRLLITDVVMPTMNGGDLAKRLKARCPRLKVLFMSGYTANVIAHHGVLEEGIHFLQKPFSRRELADKVQQALGG